MPSYATAVPIIGGASLILGALLACIVDTRLVRLETGNRVAPRYFSAAIADPKRLPYWAFFVGNLIYASCLPLTAMWQWQMAGDLGVDYDGSPLFTGAVVTAFCAVLFLLPCMHSTDWKSRGGEETVLRRSIRRRFYSGVCCHSLCVWFR